MKRDRLGVKDSVLIHKSTDKSTVNLLVDVLDFDKHFEYVGIE